MREQRPKTIESKCEFCGKPFIARRKSIGYTSYCDDCKKKKPWASSKNFKLSVN